MPGDMFIKIKGAKTGFIQGESNDTDKELVNTIDVLSWTWGITTSREASTGLATGRRQHSPFSFSKTIDKASPQLAHALISNEEITEAILTCRKPGISGAEPVKYFVMKFEKARVASISRKFEGFGSTSNYREIPIETVTIVYGKYTENYTQTVDGKKGDQNQAEDDWNQQA